MSYLTVNKFTLFEANSPRKPTVTMTTPQKNPSPNVDRLTWTSLKKISRSCTRIAKHPTPT